MQRYRRRPRVSLPNGIAVTGVQRIVYVVECVFTDLVGPFVFELAPNLVGSITSSPPFESKLRSRGEESTHSGPVGEVYSV